MRLSLLIVELPSEVHHPDQNTKDRKDPELTSESEVSVWPVEQVHVLVPIGRIVSQIIYRTQQKNRKSCYAVAQNYLRENKEQKNFVFTARRRYAGRGYFLFALVL